MHYEDKRHCRRAMTVLDSDAIMNSPSPSSHLRVSGTLPFANCSASDLIPSSTPRIKSAYSWFRKPTRKRKSPKDPRYPGNLYRLSLNEYVQITWVRPPPISE